MNEEVKRIVEVVIGFDVDEEEIKYIKSDFMDSDSNYKDPINYTYQLLEMGLEKWVREKIGIYCPNCEAEIKDEWTYCPSCGWNQNG